MIFMGKMRDNALRLGKYIDSALAAEIGTGEINLILMLTLIQIYTKLVYTKIVYIQELFYDKKYHIKRRRGTYS